MPKLPAQSYTEVAAFAVIMITLACKHEDSNQRRDMIRAATEMFWLAARQSAFSIMRQKCSNMLSDERHSDEVLDIAQAALDNMDRLEKATKRCNVLADLLVEDHHGQA